MPSRCYLSQGSWIAGRELKGNHSSCCQCHWCNSIYIRPYWTFNRIIFAMVFKKRDSTKSPPPFCEGNVPRHINIQSRSSGSTRMAPWDTHHGKNAGGPLGMVPLIMVFLGFPQFPLDPQRRRHKSSCSKPIDFKYAKGPPNSSGRLAQFFGTPTGWDSKPKIHKSSSLFRCNSRENLNSILGLQYFTKKNWCIY